MDTVLLLLVMLSNVSMSAHFDLDRTYIDDTFLSPHYFFWVSQPSDIVRANLCTLRLFSSSNQLKTGHLRQDGNSQDRRDLAQEITKF